MKRIFYPLVTALVALVLCIPAKAEKYYVSNRFDLVRALATGLYHEGGVQKYQLADYDILVLAADMVWDQKEDNSDVIGIGVQDQQFSIDLNGHKIQRNISNPVGDYGTSVISFKLIDGMGTRRLRIYDSKGGGAIIASSSRIPVGNTLCAVDFPINCNGDCELYVYGGDLVSYIYDAGGPDCFGIRDGVGQKVSVYAGNHSGYYSYATSRKSTLNLYGGTFGSTYNITTGNYAAVQLVNGANGVWKGTTIYGLGTNMDLANVLASTSDVYINDTESTIDDLCNLAVASRNRTKIALADNYGLQINNTAVTSLNAADVLGDGTVSYKSRHDNPGYFGLYLKNANLTSITTNTDDALWIFISGENTLNGDLISYGAPVYINSLSGTISGLQPTDKLSISYAAETPVIIYDNDLSIDFAVGVYVDGKNNKNAVECRKLTLNRCWFEATTTGTGPAVNCTSNNIKSCELVSGSLTGKSVAYQPSNLGIFDEFILSRQLNQFDFDQPVITGEGISGKVEYLSEGILKLTNATIDARGKGVSALSGKWRIITFSGPCFIISDNKPALDLQIKSTVEIVSDGGEQDHLYIISNNKEAILTSNIHGLNFGYLNDNASWKPVSIISGMGDGINNGAEASVAVHGNLDICVDQSYASPLYKGGISSSYSIRVSNYGGSWDSEDKEFKTAAGKRADHVVFRRNAAFTLSGEGYPVEVAGVSITEGNAADVLGDGKISYNAATNTLTLNNVEMYTDYLPFIRVISGGLNIVLKGTNIVSSSAPNGTIYTAGGDLTISGTQADSLFVTGHGSQGIYRMTEGYALNITGGCYVKAACYDNNMLTSYSSMAVNSDSIYVSGSDLVAENFSENESNKYALYIGASTLNLNNSELQEGEPNTPERVVISRIIGEGIEETSELSNQNSATKVLRNGILYIIRDNKIYNAQGQQIR